MEIQKRKSQGGARKGAGRKKGIGLSYTIKKECSILIENLLKDELFKSKAIQQLLDLKENSETEDYFYILKSENKYKFGYSSNFNKRIKVYKTHNIDIKVILVLKANNCFELESNMISMYDKNRIDNTEWFNFNNEELFYILDYINTLN
jgi:hypothetical protein